MRFTAAFLLVAACTPAPPPGQDASADPAPRPAATPAASSAPAAPEGLATSVGSVAPNGTAGPAAEERGDDGPKEMAREVVEEVVEAPALVGDDGELLPQTEEQPSVESKLFQQRARRLFEAIAKNDPELARDFFFPRAAYEKVKAIKHPGRDWDARLWKLFVRDVGDYHRKVGDAPVFVRVEVPIEKSEWMKPHREGNAIGYHRVKRAQLVYRDGEGKERSLEITSMISWRGEWYVVHLHGFK